LQISFLANQFPDDGSVTIASTLAGLVAFGLASLLLARNRAKPKVFLQS